MLLATAGKTLYDSVHLAKRFAHHGRTWTNYTTDTTHNFLLNSVVLCGRLSSVVTCVNTLVNRGCCVEDVYSLLTWCADRESDFSVFWNHSGQIWWGRLVYGTWWMVKKLLVLVVSMSVTALLNLPLLDFIHPDINELDTISYKTLIHWLGYTFFYALFGWTGHFRHSVP